MQKRKSNRLLEEYIKVNDSFIDKEVKNLDELHLIIDELFDLNNHDLTGYDKKIFLKISNFQEDEILLNKVLSGKIPDIFSRVEFKNIDLTIGLNGVFFNGELVFSNIRLYILRINKSEIHQLEFDGIKKLNSHMLFGVDDNNKINKLIINYGENIDEIRLSGINHSPNQIDIVELGFISSQLVEITGNFAKNITIRDSNIHNLNISEKENIELNIKISDSNFNNINLYNSIGNELEFINNSISEINFYNFFFKKINIDTLKSREDLFKGFLDVGGSHFEKIFNLNDEKYHNNDTQLIKIKYGNDKKYGIFSRNDINVNYSLSKLTSINQIKIHSSDENFNKYNNLSILFKKCKFLDDGYYYLGGLSLDTLSFRSSTNLSKIFKLISLDINNLEIDDHDFGRTIFSNVVINKSFKLYSPIFNDCIFNNLDFSKIKYNAELVYDLNNGELKDYYRQLKHVMDQNGNYTEGNHFFAKEMEVYGNSLNNNLDKSIYWIQKIISNFGNNWIIPLLFILLYGLLITTINFELTYCMDSCNVISKSTSCVGFFFNTFAQNINPLQDLTEGTVTFVTLIHKLILGFLIYHLFMSLKRMTKR